MYQFKTNLFESQHRKSVIGTIASTLGWKNKGDHAEDDSGHSVHVENGYYHLRHHGNDTGISDHHHDDIVHKKSGEVLKKGMVSKILDYINK